MYHFKNKFTYLFIIFHFIVYYYYMTQTPEHITI